MSLGLTMVVGGGWQLHLRSSLIFTRAGPRLSDNHCSMYRQDSFSSPLKEAACSRYQLQQFFIASSPIPRTTVHSFTCQAQGKILMSLTCLFLLVCPLGLAICIMHGKGDKLIGHQDAMTALENLALCAGLGLQYTQWHTQRHLSFSN